jgi:hypothetical protein
MFEVQSTSSGHLEELSEKQPPEVSPLDTKDSDSIEEGFASTASSQSTRDILHSSSSDRCPSSFGEVYDPVCIVGIGIYVFQV